MPIKRSIYTKGPANYEDPKNRIYAIGDLEEAFIEIIKRKTTNFNLFELVRELTINSGDLGELKKQSLTNTVTPLLEREELQKKLKDYFTLGNELYKNIEGMTTKKQIVAINGIPKFGAKTRDKINYNFSFNVFGTPPDLVDPFGHSIEYLAQNISDKNIIVQYYSKDMEKNNLIFDLYNKLTNHYNTSNAFRLISKETGYYDESGSLKLFSEE